MMIRKIVSTDNLSEICEIDKEAFSSEWQKNIYEKMLTSKIYSLFGAYVNTKLVGFICMADMTDVEEVIRVAVKKSYRKKGIGEALVSYILKNPSRAEVFLEVRKSNLSAINLYKKCGFKNIGIRKNYYQDNKEDAIVMKINL